MARSIRSSLVFRGRTIHQVLAAAWVVGSVALIGSPRAAGQEIGTPQAMQVRLQARGTLELDPTGQRATTSPFAVDAEFDYVETLRRQGEGTWVAARQFDKAEASIRVGQGSTRSQLEELDGVVVEVARQHDDRQVDTELLRAEEPLSNEEIDLLKLAGWSPSIASWGEAAKSHGLGESWEPAGWTLAAALAIDRIDESDVRCRVRRRTAEQVEITVEGSVSGVAASVPTDIVVMGTLKTDARTGRVMEADLEVREDRVIGAAAPGFSAKTKIQLRTLRPASWAATSQGQLESVLAGLEQAIDLRTFESAHHGFRLAHSADWKLIADSPRGVIFRLVDAGDLIAQAHASRLDPLPAGTALTKERYRQDVARAIGQTQAQIVDVEETQTQDGNAVIRAIVSGQVSNVGIQWIYYHVSAKDGRRVGVVLTLEQDRLERLGVKDQLLIETLEFLDEPTEARTADSAAGAAIK